jgi:hypothetical protein
MENDLEWTFVKKPATTHVCQEMTKRSSLIKNLKVDRHAILERKAW